MTHISSSPLQIDDYINVLLNGDKLTIDGEVLKQVDESFAFLTAFAVDKIIYGVNTGLGPMAQYRIDDADQVALQYNLIRSHAAGSGEPLDPICVRAAMISRLKSLSLGYSGVHADAINLLATLLNHQVVPFIPAHGGVGASGDLVQLAHLALVLIGEGEVYYEGQRRPTKEVYEQLQIVPLKVHLREGLGLINGTSVMSGIGVTNVIFAKRALAWSVVASSLINELVGSFDDHFSEVLNGVKRHAGQHAIAGTMRELLKDSRLIKKRDDHLFNGRIEEKIFKQKIQEYYSLRCVPQVLGPILDTLKNTREVLIDEVNSVNDNPIVDRKSGTVYHGGNFHGDYVSLEMDKLKIAMTKLSMLAERQLNFLMNNKLNDILPPFVNLGVLGLNLGMQGTQFTATSTVAENQTLSNPMYVHSIPSNNDNQDIVSMGTNAALMTKKVIRNTYEVLAIEFLTLLQAVDYLGVQDSLASRTRKQYDVLRALVPVFSEDTPRYTDLDKIRQFLFENDPLNPDI